MDERRRASDHLGSDVSALRTSVAELKVDLITLTVMVRKALYGNGEVGLFEKVRDLTRWQAEHDTEESARDKDRRRSRRDLSVILIDVGWDALKWLIGSGLAIAVWRLVTGH